MTLTIGEAADRWLTTVATRKRNPIKPSSSAIFQSRVRVHIAPSIGSMSIAEFGNKQMRDFVAELARKNLAPKTILEITSTVRQIIGSIIDQDTGEPVFNRTWNADFIDIPAVENQHQPTISATEIEKAITSAPSECDAALWALATASGARIGELQALRIGPNAGPSCWNPKDATLSIHSTIWRGQEQEPKTKAAHRIVELSPDINEMLNRFTYSRTGFVFGNGKAPDVSTLRSHLDAVLPGKGFHSMRRFRTTTLRSASCQESVIRYWLGHSDGTSVTNRYDKSASDGNLRRRLANEIGLGFSLPEVSR